MHFRVVLTGSPCKLSGSISAPARKNPWQIPSVPPREFQAIQHRRNDVTTSRSLAQGNALAGSREDELWASSPPLLDSVGRNKDAPTRSGRGNKEVGECENHSEVFLFVAVWSHLPHPSHLRGHHSNTWGCWSYTGHGENQQWLPLPLCGLFSSLLAASCHPHNYGCPIHRKIIWIPTDFTRDISWP